MNKINNNYLTYACQGAKIFLTNFFQIKIEFPGF